MAVELPMAHRLEMALIAGRHSTNIEQLGFAGQLQFPTVPLDGFDDSPFEFVTTDQEDDNDDDDMMDSSSSVLSAQLISSTTSKVQVPNLMLCGPGIMSPAPLILPASLSLGDLGIPSVKGSSSPKATQPVLIPQIVMTPSIEEQPIPQPHKPTSDGKLSPTSVTARTSPRPPSRAIDGKYACPECDRTFAQRSNLTTHAKVHDSTRPYACPVGCGKHFKHSNSLRKHVKLSHPRHASRWNLQQTVTNSYFKCEFCPELCLHFPDLGRHMKQHHAKYTDLSCSE
eukprot:m.33518 g.33518  ORF g.33518 m.33518 type:complete len:284 (-) comp9635_c0_seq2:247-1098(-)